MGTTGPEAVRLAASAGLILDPWQQYCIDVLLSEREDGRWATRAGALIVPRQNGKGGILEAVELAALFLADVQLIRHSAHLAKTSMDAFNRLWWLIKDTPDLKSQVAHVSRTNGQEGIELHSGQRIAFTTRTGGAGRGESPELVILDEAYNLDDGALSALIPSSSAQINPLTIYTSSAPIDGDPKSNVLRRVGKRGRKGDPTLAYVEYCSTLTVDLEDPADAARAEVELMDPAKWAEANPSYGVVREKTVGIGDEAIISERQELTALDFARERLGIWDDSDDDADGVITEEVWTATTQKASKVKKGQRAFALEIAEFGKAATFAVAGHSTFGEFVHGEIVDYRKGTDWVVDRAEQLYDTHKIPIAIVKGSPAAAKKDDLVAAGVEVIEVTTDDNASACGQFLELVNDLGFVHLPDPALALAVRLAELREYSDGLWVWSRKKSSVDISPLAAVTVACWVFRNMKPERGPELW